MIKFKQHLQEISQKTIDSYASKAHRERGPKSNSPQREKGRRTAFLKSTGRAKLNPPESVGYNPNAKVYPSKVGKAKEIEAGIQKRKEAGYRK